MSYYIDLHLITLVAFVPDPKYKLEGLPAYLDAYYKFLGFNRNQDSQLQSISELNTHLYTLETDFIIDINTIVNDVRS